MQSFKNNLKDNLKWYLLATLFIATVFIWYAIFRESREDILTVAFLDVGQGDSIFIEAPNGNQLLIDGGANRQVLRELSRVMPFYDRSIDVVLGTHPDKDHVGGLPSVFENFNVDFYIDPGLPDSSGFYQELLNDVRREPAEKIVARRGITIVLDDNVRLFILFPDRDVVGLESNDASIVARLVYGDTAFLFTGDSPQKIENHLISLDAGALKSDVLKVGHHGSNTSSSDLFIGFVAPRFSVISSGKENRYGHPHEEVLKRLIAFQSTILRTDEAGMIVFENDGDTIAVR